MHRTRSARRANEHRRERAARLQEPLPLAVQRETAAVRAAEHAERYPKPPAYNPTIDVRGDPTLRGQPVPVFRPRFRSWRGFDVPALIGLGLAALLGRRK